MLFYTNTNLAFVGISIHHRHQSRISILASWRKRFVHTQNLHTLTGYSVLVVSFKMLYWCMGGKPSDILCVLDFLGLITSDYNVQEEWRLIRDFVMRFPAIILNTVKYIEAGKPAPHLLCQFLCSLARTISSYYRSTKILLVRFRMYNSHYRVQC